MPDHSLSQQVADASDHFREHFKQMPRWIVAAPGRVNLIGEHIDYNDGFVLPMAIDKYCVIAACESPNDSATLYSVEMSQGAVLPTVPQKRDAESNPWSGYVAGVMAGFAERGMKPGGFRAVVHSTVPVGGGLSSSAALEVATATLLETMAGSPLDPIEKALLCQKAEHEFAGVPCGIMDQFASVLCEADHLMLLDCRSQEVQQIPFVDPAVTALVIDTRVKHQLSGGEYAERRRQCESAARKLGVASLRDARLPQLNARRKALDEVEYRRARHVIGEIGRTAAAASCVRESNWSEVGRFMYQSHDSLRDDYEVSCRELDLLVDFARELGERGGVIGSRMTGGGFGGSTVSLVESDKVDAVAEQLCDKYRSATGIEPAVLTSRPSRGAHVVRVDDSPERDDIGGGMCSRGDE